MEFFQAVKNRISVREYSDKPVEKEKLEKIIEAARLAPTARAIEPWEFIVIMDRKKIKELAGITDHGKFMSAASAAIAVFCKETKYYLEDGSAATENILLAAADLELGACWIAGDKKAYCPLIASALGVPEGYRLISLISLGYPKAAVKPHQKRTLKEVLHWEKF